MQEIMLNFIHATEKPSASIRANVGAGHRTSQYTARLAVDERTRHDAFALRYRSYLNSGFIEQNLTKLFIDKFDDLPDTQTVVVYDQDRPLASIRLCYLSRHTPVSSPAQGTFPEAVTQLLAGSPVGQCGHEAVELTRLVRCPSAANNQGLVFLLLRVAGHLALQTDFRIILSCVRQHHVAFYKRLRFQEATELRSYPGLNCPMQMLTCSRADYDKARAGFPIINPGATPAGDLDGLLNGKVVSLSLNQRSQAT